jgi:hypothetical protein
MSLIKNLNFSILVGTIFISGCFHKSDTTGTADNIQHSFTCHTAKGDYLITHEEIFHATSKSSGPKGTFISGYTDYRYTVRDMQTGTQVTRLITGDRDEDFIPLGFDGKQLWCYSVKKNEGLQARDPVTLQVIITKEQLEKENPALAGNLATPKVYEADRFYFFDLINNTIIVTDQKGDFFSIDPNILKAIAIKEKPSTPGSFSHVHASGIYERNGKRIYLSGDLRKHIDLGNNVESDESFLSGEILLEQNSSNLSAISAEMMKDYRNSLQKNRHRYDSLLQLYPVLNDQRQAYLSIKDYHLLDNFYDLKRNMEDEERDSADKSKEIINSLSSVALGGDSNTIYILHANNLTDTSSVLISKVNIRNNSSIIQWTTLVPQIYFDPSKGIKRDRMAEVFKSGNPEFGYEWYGLEGKVLVGIKMLFSFGIDINTGKLLWKEQL